MSTFSKGVVPAESPAKQKIPFYINRNYAFLWCGQAISALGDLIFGTTLTLWVVTDIAVGQTWAPTAMGGVAICSSLPTILVGPIAGVFVDRWDKKRLMIWMDLIRALCVTLLLLLALPLPFLPAGHLSPLGEIGAIYAFVVLCTTCSLFFYPARIAIIQGVVDESALEQASGLAMLTQNLSRIIGPLLAAPTLFVFGIQWALLIDAVSFLISIAAVSRVKAEEPRRTLPRDQPRPSFWLDFKEGLLFLGRSRLLVVLLLALSFLLIGDSAEQTLAVFFVLDKLHLPAYLYGIIGTVGGTGGILGALLGTVVVRRLGASRSFWIGITGFGLLLFLFSRMTQFIPALVLIFLTSFPLAISNIAFAPLMLRAIPRNLLGRIDATFSTCLSISSILAVSLVTTLASLLHTLNAHLFFFQFGPYDTVLSLGGLTTLLVGIGAALMLRNVSSGAQSERQEAQGKAL